MISLWLCNFIPSAIAMDSTSWFPSFNPMNKIRQVREKYVNNKVVSCIGAASLLGTTVLSGSCIPLTLFAAVAYYQNSLKLDMDRIKREILEGTQKMIKASEENIKNHVTQVKEEILDGTGQKITASEENMKNHVTEVAEKLQSIINGNQKDNIEKHELTHTELKSLHALWQSTQEAVSTISQNVTDMQILNQKMNEKIANEGEKTRAHFDTQLKQQYEEIFNKCEQSNKVLTNLNNNIESVRQLGGEHFTDLVSGITTMHETMKNELPNINSQLQAMKIQLGGMEDKITKIDQKVDNLITNNSVHNELIHQLLDEQQKTTAQLTEFQKMLLGLTKQNKEIQQEVEMLKGMTQQTQNKVNDIDNKVDNLHKTVKDNAVQTKTQIDSVKEELTASGMQNAQFVVFALQHPGQKNPYEQDKKDNVEVEDVTDNFVGTQSFVNSNISSNQSKIDEILDNTRKTADNTEKILARVNRRKSPQQNVYLLGVPANEVELKDLKHYFDNPMQKQPSYSLVFGLGKSIPESKKTRTINYNPAGFDDNEDQVKPTLLSVQPINLHRTLSGSPLIFASRQRTSTPIKFVFNQNVNVKLNNQMV